MAWSLKIFMLSHRLAKTEGNVIRNFQTAESGTAVRTNRFINFVDAADRWFKEFWKSGRSSSISEYSSKSHRNHSSSIMRNVKAMLSEICIQAWKLPNCVNSHRLVEMSELSKFANKRGYLTSWTRSDSSKRQSDAIRNLQIAEKVFLIP